MCVNVCLCWFLHGNTTVCCAFWHIVAGVSLWSQTGGLDVSMERGKNKQTQQHVGTFVQSGFAGGKRVTHHSTETNHQRQTEAAGKTPTFKRLFPLFTNCLSIEDCFSIKVRHLGPFEFLHCKWCNSLVQDDDSQTFFLFDFKCRRIRRWRKPNVVFSKNSEVILGSR